MLIVSQPWYVSLIFLITFALSLKLTVGDENIKCIEIERQSLLSFKNDVDDKYDILSSWTRNEDCCNWKGVKCSNLTHHVIELDLHGSSDLTLRGTIGPSLLKLSHLSYLDLSSNNFQQISILNHIDSLVHLMYLDLSSNGFFGVVPSCLGNLSSLQTLDLHALTLELDSKSLDWLLRLSSLQHLDLSYIKLMDVNDWMQVISKLPNLKTLKLSFCNLPPPIFPYTNNNNISTTLSKLDLSENDLTSSSIFSWLTNFSTSLVYLDLSSNKLQGYIPNLFGNMTSLSYIDFGDNQFEGVSSKSFWNFCNLYSLDFSRNKFIGTFSDFIQILPGCALNSLRSLRFSENKFSGKLVDFSTFPNLEQLDLCSNELSGPIPMNLGQLSNLETLCLGQNSLEGAISEAHFSNLTKLNYMDLSLNSLSFHLNSNWFPPFQLDSIYLRSCKLGPKFPDWLHGQKFYVLDISNTSIFDIIPPWFWNFSSNLQVLDLSYNKIRGQLPNLSISFTSLLAIILRSNEFEGQIPSFLSQAEILDVSHNKFSGLNFLCEIDTISPLVAVDMSNNQLLGGLPNCFSSNLSNLAVLNMASNGFSGGNIPSSLSNLSGLNALHLHNNGFNGEFPSWLKDLNNLGVLDLEGNNLSGEIPTWIGNKLSNLYHLSLRSNQFYGELPSSLCHLNALLLLDLSLNNFVGAIPNCLDNLTALAGMNTPFSYQYIYLSIGPLSYNTKKTSGEIIMTWKGRELTMEEEMPLLQTIDLSGNHFTGKIPNGITKLVGLISLNLSRNNLTGGIPENIGQLKSLDFLDLSRNKLGGEIPSSLSQINGLGVLDLSFNKLSGKIPVGTQLQSFNVSTYVGNLDLCGSPLPRCFDEETVPTSTNQTKVLAFENEFATRGFYISLVVGFIVGFWGISGTLIFHRSCRHAYFGFMNDVNDWLYVKTAIFANTMKKLFSS